MGAKDEQREILSIRKSLALNTRFSLLSGMCAAPAKMGSSILHYSSTFR